MTLVKHRARVFAVVGLSMVPPSHLPPRIVQASAPRIEVRAGKTRVHLTPAMTRALVAYDASFRPWDYGDYGDWVRRSSPPTPNEALSVLVGDFNGDGQPDVVMAGRRGTAGVLAAILSDSGRYRVVEMSRAEGDTAASGMGGPQVAGRDTYLKAVQPGDIDMPVYDASEEVWKHVDWKAVGTTRFLRLHTEAISEIYEEKGASLCVFADGRFWWLAFGD